jgi:hypothetical protein
MAEVKLTKLIKAHGETLTVLTLREPTGADIAECGYPFKFESAGPGQVRVFDAPAVSRYISELAGIPLPSVGQMSVIDWSRAMGEVIGFFSDPPAETSKDS